MDRFDGLSHFTAVFAVVVGFMSVARTARLLIFDDYPPMIWLRTKFFTRVGPDNPWADLLRCPFCVAPYLTAGMLAWAYLSDLHWTWWLINGWWAASYVASIVVAYDEPAEQ